MCGVRGRVQWVMVLTRPEGHRLCQFDLQDVALEHQAHGGVDGLLAHAEVPRLLPRREDPEHLFALVHQLGDRGGADLLADEHLREQLEGVLVECAPVQLRVHLLLSLNARHELDHLLAPGIEVQDALVLGQALDELRIELVVRQDGDEPAVADALGDWLLQPSALQLLVAQLAQLLELLGQLGLQLLLLRDVGLVAARGHARLHLLHLLLLVRRRPGPLPHGHLILGSCHCCRSVAAAPSQSSFSFFG